MVIISRVFIIFNLYIYDEFLKSRIHQVLGVKFYVDDIICFNRNLKLKS